MPFMANESIIRFDLQRCFQMLLLPIIIKYDFLVHYLISWLEIEFNNGAILCILSIPYAIWIIKIKSLGINVLSVYLCHKIEIYV